MYRFIQRTEDHYCAKRYNRKTGSFITITDHRVSNAVPFNPRNRIGFNTRVKTINNDYITLLKEKLKNVTDYAEEKVRVYIFNELTDKKTKEYIDEYSVYSDIYLLLYHKILIPDCDRILNSSERRIFCSEIYMFNPYKFRRSEPGVIVYNTVNESVIQYRGKLTDSFIKEPMSTEFFDENSFPELFHTETNGWN